MARTPLFHQLRKTLRLAHAAEQRGRPTREILDERAYALRASRRDFLRLTGVGIAAASLPIVGCGDDDSGGGGVRVGIVGGGIAGLVCAHRLKAQGVSVRVYDAWNRVGGRMFTARDMFASGQVAELGGELIDTGHTTIRGLAEELGLTLDAVGDEPANIRKESYFIDGALVPEEDIVDAFRVVAPHMASAVEMAEAEGADEYFEMLDQMSIEEWLGSLTDLDPVLEKVLLSAYLTEYGLECDQQSIFNLLYLIDYETPDPFRIFGESDEYFHVRGGNEQIPERIAEGLANEIEVEHQLVRLRKLASGTYELTFDRGGTSVTETFEHVVLALPFSTLRDVEIDADFTAEKQQIIDEIGYGTNAKLMGGFSSRPWRTMHQASGSAFLDNALQTLWETSRKQDGDEGILTCFLGGDEGVAVGTGTADERWRERLPLLDALFPGSEAAYENAVRMHWPTVPYVKGSYTCYRPGQWSFFGLEKERMGNVHFAGEHTSEDFQGFMEGGAESGERVAQEILADLGMGSTEALIVAPARIGQRTRARRLRLRGTGRS